MIQIKDKSACCGCSACVQRCSKNCISLKEDKEGFIYPFVDKEKCVECGLCEKVCPVINQNEPRTPLKVYAAKHKDEEIRLKSSSGGIFTLLAEQIIDEGGVVFGARFDEFWEVMHDYTETKDGVAAFRGSKYVQSKIGNTYQQAESFLKGGRKVMYTGTPCQIAGLKHYLRKEYANLLAVDFVCHGVPSPKVWRMYLNETIAKLNIKKKTVSSNALLRKEFIRNIEFRSKLTGWKKFSFAFTYNKKIVDGEESVALFSTKFDDNPYMQAFLENYILRPSCYKCFVKEGRSKADITLGDFWGIEYFMSEFDDDKGCGLIMVYKEDKNMFFSCELESSTYEAAQKGNLSIYTSVREPINREFFFHRIELNKSCIHTMEEMNSKNLSLRIYRTLFRKFVK